MGVGQGVKKIVGSGILPLKKSGTWDVSLQNEWDLGFKGPLYTPSPLSSVTNFRDDKHLTDPLTGLAWNTLADNICLCATQTTEAFIHLLEEKQNLSPDFLLSYSLVKKSGKNK